jgi:hypothetical protein
LDCCRSGRRLKGRSGVDAPDIQDDHPRNHVDDSTGDHKGINSQKNCIHNRLGFGRRLREKKVKYGFAEQNEQDGYPDGGSEEIQFGVRHLDSIQREQRIKKPCGENPKGDDSDDAKSLF